MHYVSKSKLMSFRQCPLRLWNEVNRREEAGETDASTQYRFDQGTRIGILAQQRWPGGRLIDAEYYQHELALKQTLEALDDLSIPAIYEAAFEASRTRVRVDIMVRRENNTWEVWEVKSSASVKEQHLLDFAIQLEVIRQWAAENHRTINVVRGGILHLNNQYVYQGGEYDLKELFVEADILQNAIRLAEEVLSVIRDGSIVLDSENAPAIEPGEQCSDPYECPFLGHVCDEPPSDPLFILPRIQAKRVEGWHEQGIHSLQALMDSCESLNPTQQRVLNAHITGKAQSAPGLKNALDALGFPRHHLDFESTGAYMALPLWKGTRPFQAIPTQFSIHTETAVDGPAFHDEFLLDTDDDPRRPLAEKLLEYLLDTEGPILMYSPYESRMIGDLMVALPDLADDLKKLKRRLLDLLPIVRDHYYSPAFNGSFSIKEVYPALVPKNAYEDLEINNGDLAALEYMRMVEMLKDNPDSDEVREEVDHIRASLLAYCKQDTWAMVELIRALQKMKD